MKVRAYGKINLGLDVVGRKDNGYHDLKMIMVPVDIYDELTIEIAPKMSLNSNRDYVKNNPTNSIISTIDYLRDKYHFKENFKININKHIPTKAGLAGGSTDAAMTIRVINKLLNLHMSHAEMKEAALAIGADVYFCLISKPSVVEGIGDIVNPFRINCDFNILLVKPRKGISTKEAFKTLDLELADHPDINLMQYSLMNDDYETFIKTLGNSLEQPSFILLNEIEVLKNRLLNAGFDGALMSGSGSTVFAITRNIKLIESISDELKKDGYFVRSVKIVK